MRIAILYNRDSQNVINLFGQPNREKIGLQLIRRIADALKKGGHQVTAFEGDKDLVDKLEEFMPRVMQGERPGLVFNLSYGIQGQARYTHVPSILEMVGVPYVGSGPLAHSIALDKVVTKMVLVQNKLPTPEFAVLQDPDFEMPEVPFPAIVKPKHEAVSFGIRVVNDEKELREAAGAIFDMFGQGVLVERFVEGREVNVGLLGNAPPEALPPVELSFGAGGPTVYSYEDKTGKSGRTIELLCPAPIGEELTARAQDLARRAFAAIGCFDCARVDMRIDERGELSILEINSLPSLGPRGSYVRAAAEAGLDFAGLVNRLVEVASARYFGTPTPPAMTGKAADPPAAVFAYLTGRRDRIERRLREWTQRQSRSSDPVGLEAAARELERTLDDLGLRPVPELGDPRHTDTFETPAGLEGGTLLVLHLDVPLDEAVPGQGFRREAEWLHGEGIGTSRAPLVVMEFALRALRNVRVLRQRKLGVLAYRDEGRECRYSADLLRQAMTRAARVLVLRPGGEGGALFHRRRGQRRYRLVVEGHPVRPGSAKGTPVLTWLAAKIGEIAALSSSRERVAASLLDLRTDGFPTFLPHRARATVLVSYRKPEAADRVEEEMRRVLGRRGPRWELTRVSDRPPLVDDPADRRLAEALGKVAERWQIPLARDSSLLPSVAGLAPAQTEVLCGLGPVARDLYTPHESVQRLSVVQRTLLLAQFLLGSQGGG